ncbi:PilN domain-containing protein [Aliivibrio kagoshimensis]|uniref:PilN domain-containing protein n=1 Tax=Aliivibrio kagoshimensis TaxID=2910230 RepID=UPI003D0DFE50
MMALNLLPWRETKQRQHRRRFVGLLIVGLGIVGFIHAMGWRHVSDQVTQQKNKESQLIASVKRQTIERKRAEKAMGNKEQLQRRLFDLTALQQQRNRATHLFNLLTASLPRGVFITGVTLEEWRLTLSGYSDTAIQFTQLVATLEGNPWINNINIHYLRSKTLKLELQQHFSLSLTILPNFTHDDV